MSDGDEIINVTATDARPGEPPLVVSLRSVAKAASEARRAGLVDVAEELEAIQDRLAEKVRTS